eukprot:TRINITY_DN14794_c0_g1_i1.p2 TRINITY_DN14794_c0_g1~~TRINITY_DN14794_c0_g1_i1.p2  ORF type:complete len:268 (-),score=0.95 TRINITY_DN14794_c0_g1_i1:28-831(-)
MIGLGRQDAGRSLDKGPGQQRRRALVGGDADILEDEGGEQERILAGEGIEGLAGGNDPGRHRCGGKGAVGADRQVEHRLRHRAGGAERVSEEGDMRDLVRRDFPRIAGQRAIGERHGAGDAGAADRTLRAGAGQQIGGQPGAGGGISVELRLEILEVEREIEDVRIGEGGGLRLRRTGHRQRRGTGGGDRHRADRMFEEVAALFAAHHARVERCGQGGAVDIGSGGHYSGSPHRAGGCGHPMMPAAVPHPARCVNSAGVGNRSIGRG